MSESFESMMYKRSASTTRTHGILSIIFGGLGVFFGSLFVLLFFIVSVSGVSSEDVVTAVLYAISTVIFFIIPHIYLIIAGIHLTKEPAPNIARTLIIINLILGVFWNIVILIMSIVNLVQLTDYERGYPHHTKKHGR